MNWALSRAFTLHHADVFASQSRSVAKTYAEEAAAIAKALRALSQLPNEMVDNGFQGQVDLYAINELKARLTYQLERLPPVPMKKPGPAPLVFLETLTKGFAAKLKKKFAVEAPRSRSSWFVKTILAAWFDSGMASDDELSLNDWDNLEGQLAGRIISILPKKHI